MTEETINWEDLAGIEEMQEPVTEEGIIYHLIETVALSDTAKLDEIDARVWCYLKGVGFAPSKLCWSGNKSNKQWEYNLYNHPRHTEAIDRYTRSLDAIDTILPKNVCTALHFQMTGWENGETNFIILDGFHTFLSPILPNENLAKLHAAVQYHAYKKRTGGLK